MIAEMSDSDLLARMKNGEDHFVERKTVNDSKDWLKTVVALLSAYRLSVRSVHRRAGRRRDPGGADQF
jgi:hypothetical protein